MGPSLTLLCSGTHKQPLQRPSLPVSLFLWMGAGHSGCVSDYCGACPHGPVMLCRAVGATV